MCKAVGLPLKSTGSKEMSQEVTVIHDNGVYRPTWTMHLSDTDIAMTFLYKVTIAERLKLILLTLVLSSNTDDSRAQCLIQVPIIGAKLNELAFEEAARASKPVTALV